MGNINLDKRQTFSLKKNDGGDLKHVRLALGWDAAPKKGFLSKMTKGNIDLDASAVLISNDTVYDTVNFLHLTSNDGSVHHTGDNLTGEGDGDDESILVDLTKVPGFVNKIVFTVNSFSGQSFKNVENAFCRVVDCDAGDAELCRYTLTDKGDYTATIMACMERVPDGWQFKAIGMQGNGRTVKEVTNLVMQAAQVF